LEERLHGSISHGSAVDISGDCRIILGQGLIDIGKITGGWGTFRTVAHIYTVIDGIIIKRGIEIAVIIGNINDGPAVHFLADIPLGYRIKIGVVFNAAAGKEENADQPK
jgi:hypothetical protein